MNSAPCSIVYGKTQINYELFFMERKSLEIAVHPDKSIVVKAPLSTSHEAVEERIRKRARWIKRQVRFFEQFDPRTPTRQFVGGESHYYLGRRYRLKIEDADQTSVLLKGGYLRVKTPKNTNQQVQKLLKEWYMKKAKQKLQEEFDHCWESFSKNKQLAQPNLNIREMQTRWGSLSSNNTLTLNTKLIQTPKECIEYVIIHELCHLIHHDHSPAFYKLLERTLPDWVKRKHKLEMSLV